MIILFELYLFFKCFIVLYGIFIQKIEYSHGHITLGIQKLIDRNEHLLHVVTVFAVMIDVELKSVEIYQKT